MRYDVMKETYRSDGTRYGMYWIASFSSEQRARGYCSRLNDALSTSEACKYSYRVQNVALEPQGN